MDVRSTIRAIVSDQPSRAALHEFLFLARKIAVVFLRKKVALGRLHPDVFALSVEDIATDALAELFQQDENGRFIQIQVYFASFDVEHASDAELLGHLRRLVFAKVNTGLFRMYNEIDPGLGKILRNVKLSVNALQNFVVLDRFGESCIVPSMCETLEELPALDHGGLQSLLAEVADRGDQIPAIMACLARALREQSTHSRIVPLVLAAQAIRAHYARPGALPEEQPSEDPFLANDASRLIHTACLSIMRATEPKYVGKKGVAPELFRTYFVVIERKLLATILQRDGEEYTFYRGLKEELPELTERDYGEEHRSRIEYLGRLAHREAVTMLEKNM